MNAKRITNNIVKKLESELSIYTTPKDKTPEYKVVVKEELNWSIVEVRNTDEGWGGVTFFASPLMDIIKVVTPYIKKYEDDIYWRVDSRPTMFDYKADEWRYQPVVVISIKK